MGKRQQGSSDDLRKIQLTDFSAGVNSMYGSLALALNESSIANTVNVLGFPGRALYAGGFTRASTMPVNDPDFAIEFYDATNAPHKVVFADGNVYDTISGAYALIEAGVYTVGDPVGAVDQAGILYYISPNMPLRKWTGIGAGAAVAGVDVPKGGTFMTAFAGSIIVANVKTNAGVYLPSAFIASAVNDPTTWLTANIQTVGTDYGGIISFILPMGISSAGIASSKSLVVGKTMGNLFLYRGAIGSQEETLINCPVACLDPLSAVYVPAPTLYGQVIFLGTDGQLWGCDGVTAEPLTADKNLNWVYGLINTAKQVPKIRFSATYNERYSYYLIDIGNNQQFAWMWKTKSLYPINGWPSGIYFKGHDGAGFAANFVAARTFYAAGVYQVGQDFTTFNGVAPIISYQTPYLHGGDGELTKDFEWAAIASRNVGASYKVVGQTLQDSENLMLSSNPLIFNDPSIESLIATEGFWDQSNWDSQAQWAPDANYANPVFRHGRLWVPVTANEWLPDGATQPLRSGAVSFIISWNPIGNLPPAFDLIGFNTRYMPRTMRTSGNDKFTAESNNGVSPDSNPWVGILS